MESFEERKEERKRKKCHGKEKEKPFVNALFVFTLMIRHKTRKRRRRNLVV